MKLSVRECVEADEVAVEELAAPDKSIRRKLFGLTHAGALIETSQVTLCTEALAETTSTDQSPSKRVTSFASFDNQVPSTVSCWPEGCEYLKNRLHVETPREFLLLTTFCFDPAFTFETNVLTLLLHELFKLRPKLAEVLVAVDITIDIQTLGIFRLTFADYDVVELSTGGLLRFYRASRQDYDPSVFVTRALSIDTTRVNQLQAMVKKNEEKKRPTWFHAATDPTRMLTNEDDHRACFVAQSVETHEPCGLLVCTDSIDTDQVNIYARLFSEFYRTANPVFEDSKSSDSIRPPSSVKASISPTPAPNLLHTTSVAEGRAHIIVLGPSGAGKGTQSKRLAREFGLVHICTGDLLREAAADASGKYPEINDAMNTGDLVPDNVVHELVLARLCQSDCTTHGWVLEGYPRTKAQAQMLMDQGGKPNVAAFLELSDADASHRGSASDYEENVDAVPALADQKLALYREHRKAVREILSTICPVIHVDAAQSRDTATKTLVHEIYQTCGSRLPFRVRHPPRLIITGAPASGKGTQCELLVRALHVVHLSTGDMLRQAIQSNTPLGKHAQEFMDGGQLVPDELIVDVVLERLSQADCLARGWLLDGFPRTQAQAQALLAARIVPDCVLALNVPDDEVVKRIAGRRLDPDTGKTYHVDFNPPPLEIADRLIQRSDDTEVTVRTRLEQFHTHSNAVVTALGGVCQVIQVDGTRPVEHVAAQLLGGAERAFLRNNAVIVSLFSMSSTYESRAPLFLAKVFEHFQEKDCLLLCLPARCSKPALVSNFRCYVREDSPVSSAARSKQSEEEKVSVLYVFHRKELPFLAKFTHLNFNESHKGQLDHVIVKGKGVKGFVRTWTKKCAQMLGLSGRKEKKNAAPRLRAVTSDSAPVDIHEGEEGNRKTIH